MSAKGPAGGGGKVGATIAWSGWWVVSAAIYLVLVDTVVLPELVTGAVIATIAATGATLLRAQRRAVMRPDPAWLLRSWRPLASVAPDLVKLCRALVSGPAATGHLYALTVKPASDTGRGAARAVLAPTAGSIAPNTFVIGYDDERALLLVHQLMRSEDPSADADPLGLR
ncbi:MAG: hypothetical protein ACRDMX_13940 [Solirubrobacteraceae bacterium]